jgi:hypothetical protein
MTPLDRTEALDQAPDDLRRRAAIAPEAPAVHEASRVAEKAAQRKRRGVVGEETGKTARMAVAARCPESAGRGTSQLARSTHDPRGRGGCRGGSVSL